MKSSRMLGAAIVAIAASSAQARSQESNLESTVTAVAVATESAMPPSDANGLLLSLTVVATGGRADLVLGVSGPVTTRDFTLSNPDKIVVDISGATLGLPMGQSYDGASRGGIVNVRYAQYTHTTVRVVLTLDKPHAYKVVRGNGELRVEVEGAAEPFNAWRAGQIVPLAHLSPRGDSVIVPLAAFMSHPAETGIVASKTTRLASSRQTQQPRQRPITISWYNTDVREVLAAFQEFSGRTIIPAKDVTGTVSANIINQPWDVAMRALLNAYGFDAKEDPSTGIIIVDTYDHLASQASIEPLDTRTVQLNYAHAATIAPMVAQRLSHDCGRTAPGVATAAAPESAPAAAPASTQPSVQQQPGVTGPPGAPSAAAAQAPSAPALTSLRCPTRGAVIPDTVTNSLSITDIPSNLGVVEAYARSLDLRQPQVNIRARIVSVDRDQLDALGLQYSLATHTQGFLSASGSGAPVDSGGTNALPGPLVALGGNALAAIANAGQTVSPATLALVFSTAMGNYDLNTFLTAAHTLLLTDDQAEPSASVLNNRTAELQSGQQIPITTVNLAAATGTPPTANIGFQQTGIILQVTPQITHNRQVQMKIHVEQSSIQSVTPQGAATNRRSVDNEVLVADGETAVMGGLTETLVSITKNGLPILVDLPIIGRLFGHTERHETKTDLLILITPHIIDEGDIAPPGAPNE